MRDLLKGVLIAGGGQGVGILFWVGVMKVIALVAGPAGVGTFSLLRQLQQVAATGAQLNGQSALIQGLASRDSVRQPTYWHEATRILAWSLMVVSALLLAFAPAVSVALGGGLGTPLVRGVVPAMMLLVALNVTTALLGAKRELTWIAVVQGVSGLAALALALPAARALTAGEPLPVLLCLAGSAAAGLLTAVLAVRRTGAYPAMLGPAPPGDHVVARMDFMRLTGALAISGGIVAATPLVVRAMLARSQGLDAVGHFDAAWTVGVSLVMLMLAAIHAYYLPTLSAAHDERERRALIARFFRFSSLLVLPALALVQVVKPWVVRLLYSAEFDAALPLLRWILIGDIALVGGWMLGMPLLVYNRRRLYVKLQVAWSVAFMAGVALVYSRPGWADGIGVVFVLTHLGLFVATAAAVRRAFAMPVWRMIVRWWVPGALLLVAVALAVEGSALVRALNDI